MFYSRFHHLFPQRWKKMHSAHAPRVLIFHSCANFFFFTFLLRFLAFFVQFWAYLLIMQKNWHFLHIFCVQCFRLEVLRVLFRQLFLSLKIQYTWYMPISIYLDTSSSPTPDPGPAVQGSLRTRSYIINQDKLLQPVNLSQCGQLHQNAGVVGSSPL